MKRISNWAIIALLAFSSCAKEFNYDPTEDIKENAEIIFGIIDPNQDWRTTNSGTVTVTANADLDDIVKVQILTESPFLNDYAKVLAEVDATAGQAVTIDYSAPREIETLIAACVDSKGHHFIKPFDINTKEVSFSSAVAMTRAFTRAEAGIDISHLTLGKDSTMRSLNANRTIYSYMATNTGDNYMVNTSTKNNLTLWDGSNWESEKLWQLSTNSTASGDWSVVDGTVVRNIAPMTSDEESVLKSIFNAFLLHKDKKGNRVDNLSKIRNSSSVKLFNSHLTSDGQPFTVIPVQMGSSDLSNCKLYYYYYNPQTVPNNISIEEYIKQLPKYKAIHCAYTKDAAGTGENDFFKMHEYLMPYYGDLVPTTITITPKAGIYRIRNVGKTSVNQNNYITHLGNNYFNSDKLAKAYSDTNENLANQLWQIFELEDGRCILYNIGSKQFLTSVGDYIESKNNWGTFYTDCLPFVKEHTFHITTNDDGTKRIKSDDFPSTFLGANSNNTNRIATNKTRNDGAFINWEFEEYTETNNIDILEELTLEADLTDHNAVSDCIPEGYRIGFMLQKANSPYKGNLVNFIAGKQNGCTFGNGKLNTIINNFPDHFISAKKTWHMKDDDTRIAMFNANNKTYLAFEDGSDTNFSDLIIEVTGRAGRMFDDVQEVEDLPYTMCFEDRPNVADYDMNDVVLRCKRVSETQLELSLIATGAQDQVYIEGIDGKLVDGTELNNKEVHELFGVSNDTFVNTQLSAEPASPVTAIYEVSDWTTIPQFLTKIYIRNISQGGNEINVPKTGEPPFALIVPGDFDYPIEQVSIINAYTTFRNWANNANNYGEWVNFFDNSKIYPNPCSNKQ